MGPAGVDSEEELKVRPPRHWTQLLDGVTDDMRTAAPMAWPRHRCTSIRRIRDRDPGVDWVEDLLATTFSDVTGGELDLLHAMARRRAPSSLALCKLLGIDLEHLNGRLVRLAELGLVTCDNRGLWELCSPSRLDGSA